MKRETREWLSRRGLFGATTQRHADDALASDKRLRKAIASALTCNLIKCSDCAKMLTAALKRSAGRSPRISSAWCVDALTSDAEAKRLRKDEI